MLAQKSEILCIHCGKQPAVGLMETREIVPVQSLLSEDEKLMRPWYGSTPTCRNCWDIYSKAKGQEHRLRSFS